MSSMQRLLFTPTARQRQDINTINAGTGGKSTPSSDPLPFRLPTSPGVTVIQAPPGMGKSHVTRLKVKEAIEAGTVKHVLWAVHGTLKDTSLGAEAAREFQALGVPASIIKGRSLFGHLNPYVAQLPWSQTPEVKIVSFAHLPLIFGEHTLLSQLRPDLLVIDELPLTGLVTEVEWNHTDLAKLQGAGQIATRLMTLLHDIRFGQAPTATHRHRTNIRQRPELQTYQHYLTGHEFQQVMGAFSDEDWQVLEQAINNNTTLRKAVGAPSHWVDAFRSALHSEGEDARFGLRWRKGPDAAQHPVFYASVLSPLLSLPPTLVLDAYADKAIYRALFHNDQVEVQKIGQHRPLQVEAAPMLSVRRDTAHRPTQYSHLLHIAEEVVQLHQVQKVAVLTDRALTNVGHPWNKALHQAAKHLSAATVPEMTYYHAGRGVNHFAGQTIVALTLAHLPRQHQHCTLAALFPTDADARANAHRHLQASEQLQMLHRGRQTRHESDIPRIIVAAAPHELMLPGVKVQPYAPIQEFTPNSTNPRLSVAVKALAQELVSTFGGVPMGALAALGLIKGYYEDKSIGLQTKALQQALQRQKGVLAPDSLLREWLETGMIKRFRDVAISKNKERPEDNWLKALGLSRSTTSHSIRIEGTHGKSTVWVPEGVSEEEVIQRYYG